MKILGFDTTGDVCSAGILDDERIVSEVSLFDKNTHSVNLMPMIDTCLTLAKMSISDLDAIAVNVGPGSFTGIRIGVCTAKGLALSLNIPCIAVNTLDALSYQALPFEGYICPLIDARRVESYFALYKNSKMSISQIWDYGADKLETFLKVLPNEPICFIGDGAENYRDVIENIVGERAIFMSKTDIRQHVSGVLKAANVMAKNKTFISVYDIAPYYHRVSQAERMRKQNVSK